MSIEVLQGMAFFAFAWGSFALFLLLPYAAKRLWALLQRQEEATVP